MYIELKKISVNENLDIGAFSYSAELHVDGDKVAYAKKDKMGAFTDLVAVSKEQEINIHHARAWVMLLPPLPFESEERHKKVLRYIKMELEDYVDHLVHEHLKIKADIPFYREMYEAMHANLIIGNPAEARYRRIGYRVPQPLGYRIDVPELREVFEKRIREQVVPSLKPTELILNNNIPIEDLIEVGIPRNKIFPAAVYKFRAVRQKLPLSGQNSKKGPRK